MLSSEEIQSIAESGEGYNAEFKVCTPSKVRALTQEVCAFVNSAGGVLLIGVDDNNKIVGVEINNIKRSAVQDTLLQSRPPISCPFYKVGVDGKDVWVIEVVSGPQKTCTLSGAIYTRQRPNTQKITSVEQMRDCPAGRSYIF